MSYHANAGGYITVGYITVKEGKELDKIEKLIRKNMEVAYRNGNTFEVFYDDKFYSDDFNDFLSEIAPYVKESLIQFTDEDDAHWKYEFIDETWEKVSGEVIYDDEPLFIVLQDNKTADIYHDLGSAKRAKNRLEKDGIKAVLVKSLFHI